MPTFSAVYDACILYPAPLRDLLLQLAVTDLFRAHWTTDIHQEWMRNVDLPDDDDRHVLAAAIVAGADVIVTYNLKDFPKEELRIYGIEAQHPDDFLTHLIDLAPSQVCAAVATIRERLRNPPRTASEYLDTLEQQQLPQTASLLRDFEGQL